MRCLVTGAAGFIGRAVQRALVLQGHDAMGFDIEPAPALYVRGDIRDADTVNRCVYASHAVFHLAYVNGTERFYREPERVLDTAVKGIVNVMGACAKWGVRQLVVFSSSEVYQHAVQIPTPEDVPLVVPDLANPRYSYGGGKILHELLAMHTGSFDRVIIVRPHNVYGPGMGYRHVIPELIMKIARAEDTITLNGDGSQTRAFMHIDDFASSLAHVFAHAPAGRHVYNIGTMEEVAIGDLARLIAVRMNRDVRIVPGPAPVGETPRRCPDTTKLRALGAPAPRKLAEGIGEVIDWYLKERDKWPAP